MDAIHQVLIPDNTPYNPFPNLKKPDLRQQVPGNIVSQTLQSIVVATPTGRIVYVPKKK